MKSKILYNKIKKGKKTYHYYKVYIPNAIIDAFGITKNHSIRWHIDIEMGEIKIIIERNKHAKEKKANRD